MTAEPELVFHDTVPVPLEQLEKGRRKAVRQKDFVLQIFKLNPTAWLTPYEVQEIYERIVGHILITSVRRSITDLTNEGITGHGRLLKGGMSHQVKERWDTNNNRWKYNPDFVKSINS